jgi:glycine hydroxymethyltransferase
MRLGTAAITTRGMLESDMEQIADYIDTVLMNHENESIITDVRKNINTWMEKFPLYK